MERYLIEKAYECAKSKFKKNSFSFKDLYESLLDAEPRIKDKSVDLYIEILQDIRFISLGKQKWALRENFSIEEINKISSSMFGLDEYHEEDADQYMSEAEKNELKSKTEKSDELILDVSDEEEDNIPRQNIRKLANQEEEEMEKHASGDHIRDDDLADDEIDIVSTILDDDDDEDGDAENIPEELENLE